MRPMAHERRPEVGTELVNPVAGTRTVFRATAASTGGAHVEVEAHYPPHSPAPPRHLHPQQEERFTVLAGRMHAVVDGVVHDLSAGDELTVPAGVGHVMWNDSDAPAAMLWRTTPALRTDQMFCDLWQAAADAEWAPSPQALLEVLQRYPDQFCFC